MPSKSGSQRTRTTVKKVAGEPSLPVRNGDNVHTANKLTDNEKTARKYRKYATTTFGFNTRLAESAYTTGGMTNSTQGNFYSPQLSTDFLEKPQNLRERRAWYRNFYNSNEFVGQAIDLHSTLPLSKIRLEKPKGSNQEQIDYMYDFFVEMCDEIKLSKVLMEMSHEFWMLGNCLAWDAEVKTLSGSKNAEDVQVGDWLLTNQGRYRRVTKVFRRPVENILRISCWKDFRTMPVTGEHPIEVFRNGEFVFEKAENLTCADYVRITWPIEVKDKKSFDFSYPENCKKLEKGIELTYKFSREKSLLQSQTRNKFVTWLRSLKSPTIRTRASLAKELEIRESVLNSVVYSLDNELDIKFHERIGAIGYQKGSQVIWFPVDIPNIEIESSYTIQRKRILDSVHGIEITNDFAYLVGYWMGDGTLARDSSRDNWGRGLWQISAENGCEDNINRVRSILVNIFGEKVVSKWKANGQTYLKVISNPAFIEWWAENFGETSFGKNFKRIPEWFVRLPVEKLKHFLAGIVDSDGSVSVSGKRALDIVAIAMASRNVMDSIRDIALKCGAVIGYTENDEREVVLPNGDMTVSRKMYCLTASDEDSCRIFCSFSNKQLPEDARFTEMNRYWQRIGNGLAFKVRSISNEEYCNLVYNFEVEEDHTYQVAGFSTHNCFAFAEDHEPYKAETDEEQAKVNEMKEWGRQESKRLYEEFKVIDKDPNYKGWRKIIILPPDQVRIKKIPLSDESLIEYIPDPETRKSILRTQDATTEQYIQDFSVNKEQAAAIPEKLLTQLKESGSLPLDTDPYSGSHVYLLARKKCQYETLGVSILERCVNTLLLQDKLRQAQTSIASRHMTPIRIVWAEEMSDSDVDNLKEQVDLALTDPDFSIITNFEVHWEEMGSNGRLLDLGTEYEHIENSLFAGLGVTREILTGEGTYTGSRITLEIMNTQYLLFRELLQDYIQNNLFKPVAKKKGFVEKDKYGREHLLYPRLAFTRLSIRDNDQFFEQMMQLYNKGSVSIDVVLDAMNIDADATRKKIEADLFTVNDFAFNQFMINLYSNTATDMVAKYNVTDRMAQYLDLQQLPPQQQGEAGGMGGLGGGMGGMRFAGDDMSTRRKKALDRILKLSMMNPEKLDKIADYLEKAKGAQQ